MKEIDDIVRLYEATNDIDPYLDKLANLVKHGKVDSDGYTNIYMQSTMLYNKTYYGYHGAIDDIYKHIENIKLVGMDPKHNFEWVYILRLRNSNLHSINDKPSKMNINRVYQHEIGLYWHTDSELDRGNDMPAQIIANPSYRTGKYEIRWYKSGLPGREFGPRVMYLDEYSDDYIKGIKDDFDIQKTRGEYFYVNGKHVSYSEYASEYNRRESTKKIKDPNSTMMDVLCAFGDL